MKEKGNNFFARNDYKNAINCYTQAVNRGAHLTPEALSILYCNRSAAFYKAGNFVKAKNDAIEACQLTPNSAKPRFRLGMAYKALEKNKKAVREFEKADVMQPRNKEIVRELLDCRHLKGKEDRQEHLDTNYIPSSHYQRAEKEAKARGHIFSGQGDKILDIPLTGNDFLDGATHTRRGLYYASKNQMKQSIQELSRAAELGNAEGMYNLGVMYSHGTGCPRNPEMAQYWFKEAIKQPRKVMGNRNVGVAEAYSGLALYLHEDPNPAKQAQAVEMWEIAAEDGLAVAQNNLGTCYEHGRVYSQDFKKASQYYQLAAQGGDHQAMLNLAKLYARGLNGPIDLKNAILWAQRAVDCGGKQGLQDLLNYKKMQEALEEVPEVAFEEFNINHIMAAPKPSWVSSQKITKESLQSCKSEYSKKLLEVIWYCEEAARLLDEGQLGLAIMAYAQGLRIPDSELVAPIYGPRMHLFIERIPEDQKTVDTVLIEFCEVLNDKGVTAALTYAKQWLPKYPKEPALLHRIGCMHNFNQEFEKGLQMFWKAKPLCTENYATMDLTYLLATTERLLGQFQQSSEHYEEFLAGCVQGHRKIPEAYYGLASNAISLKMTEKVSEFYFRGLEVEKTLPKMFHTSSPMKQMAAKVVEILQKSAKKECPKIKQTFTTVSQIFEAPSHLDFNEIARKQILLSLREGYKDGWDPNFHQSLPLAKPSRQSTDARWAKSKVVFLEDLISHGQDHVHAGTHLDCMVVALPVQLIAIHMCIVDAKGTLMKLAIYNFDEKLRQKLVVGQTLIIPNPYFRLTASGENNIRVDAPQKLEFGKLWSCCFYCLNLSDALKVCKGCLQAKYCSVDCQRNDWHLLNHKSECQWYKQRRG
jgi:TPR repeat protein